MRSPTRDFTLTISGSGPGLQFYRLGSGVILEPQGFPNAVNEPRFPPAILSAGEPYRADIEYGLAAP